MSLNTAHRENGFYLFTGEQIILFAKNVGLEFDGNKIPEFKGSKTGNMCLTTHRMIFLNDKKTDSLMSFSIPFVALSQIGLEQPVFGANYITGKVTAQENGNFTGTVKVKMTFKNGGACDFGQAILKLTELVKRFGFNGPPPAYTAPSAPFYEAPPPAYTPNNNYYGWAPPTQLFSPPPVGNIYMVNSPPPYPGIHGMGQNVYAGASNPSAPTAPGNMKAAEAAQSAYYDPNKPQYAYVPPPAYAEYPPSYDQALNKKDA